MASRPRPWPQRVAFADGDAQLGLAADRIDVVVHHVADVDAARVLDRQAAPIGARVQQFVAIERQVVVIGGCERAGSVVPREISVGAPAEVVVRVTETLFPQDDALTARHFAFDDRRHRPPPAAAPSASASIASSARRTTAASFG